MDYSSVSRRVEDYLIAVLELKLERGCGRITEIASLLHVKPPTASEMIQRLAAEGLVKYCRYGPVFLTAYGEEVAENAFERRRTIERFLNGLHVPPIIAMKDAMKIENELHPDTVRQLRLFIEKLGEH